MIGGSGERKTLRTIAKFADMWNGMGRPERMQHKMEVLVQHCADVGRDPNTIIKTTALKPVIRDSVAGIGREYAGFLESIKSCSGAVRPRRCL